MNTFNNINFSSLAPPAIPNMFNMNSTPLFFFLIFFFLMSCSKQKDSDSRIYLAPGITCGTVQFTDGCNPRTDTLIRFGITMIHHMGYEDAAHTFENIIKKDRDCFWGYWGKAMSYIHPLWPDTLTSEEMESGYKLSHRAMSLAKKDKEKLYGTAIVAFFAKEPKTKVGRLADAEKAWATAHEQLPDDPEAELFHGLFKLSTVSPSDKSDAVRREVGAMAERVLKKYPDHPGAFQYGIQAYDVQKLASNALEMARNYGRITPEIPYAMQLPSHIFTWLGLWQESIDGNKKSLASALKLPADDMVSPDAYHAMDYLVYAYLQLGEDQKAREVLAYMDTLKDPFIASDARAYSLATMHSRILLEQHHWVEAASIARPDTIKFPWYKFPQYKALIYFGRGLGAGRWGNNNIGVDAFKRLFVLHQSLGDTIANKYWHDQMNIQELSLKAWFVLDKGNFESAVKFMTNAADLEDEIQHNPVSSGELLPARELLGDMFMVMNQPADALAAYEKSLKTRPNRFNTLYGAGKAAEKTGDMAKAKDFFSKLIALKGETPTTREEYIYAVNVVNAKK